MLAFRARRLSLMMASIYEFTTSSDAIMHAYISRRQARVAAEIRAAPIARTPLLDGLPCSGLPRIFTKDAGICYDDDISFSCRAYFAASTAGMPAWRRRAITLFKKFSHCGLRPTLLSTADGVDDGERNVISTPSLQQMKNADRALIFAITISLNYTP